MLPFHSYLLSFYYDVHHRHLHSFPTRRSSDLQITPDLFPLSFPTCPDFIYHLASTVGVRNVLADPKEAIEDRKSTRLNSSHVRISYAVFCLKKKKNTKINSQPISLTLNTTPPD